ncbi:hypothetical protein H7H78_17110, partial [Mycobacterium shinjukuense]
MEYHSGSSASSDDEGEGENPDSSVSSGTSSFTNSEDYTPVTASTPTSTTSPTSEAFSATTISTDGLPDLNVTLSPNSRIIVHTGDDWYRVYDGNGNIIEEGDTGSLKLDYARQQQYRLDGPDSDDTTEGSSFSQDKEDEDKEDDFKSDSDEEPLERKPKEVES